MPRYHVIIKDTSLGAVQKEMEITAQQDGSDVLVDLRAPDKQTAKNAVVARLPRGSHFKVEEPEEVP